MNLLINAPIFLNAIEKIRINHPLKYLFVWTFSTDGDLVAEEIVRLTTLRLFKRK